MANFLDDSGLSHLWDRLKSFFSKKVDNVLLEDTVGWTGKNLAPSIATNFGIEADGISATVNEDKSITINGTATDNIFRICSDFYLDAGEYILSGGPSGSGYGLYIDASVNPDIPADIVDRGDGVAFTLTTRGRILLRYFVYSGTTVSNLTFYPMIRRADILDDTYEPYHAPVPETTQTLISDAVGWTGKNLLQYQNAFPPAEYYGVTITMGADGTITMNGTSTQDFYFRLYSGTGSESQKFSGCLYNGVTGGSASTYYSRIIKFADPWTLYATLYDGDAVISNIPNDNSPIQIDIIVLSGIQLNNVTFKPMIRRADIADPTYEPYHAPVSTISDNIAPTEGATASGAYTAGSYIIWQDGKMYQVTANVSQGTTWAVGTNLAKKNINDVFYDLRYRGINHEPLVVGSFNDIPAIGGVQWDIVNNSNPISDSPYPSTGSCYGVLTCSGWNDHDRRFQLATGIHCSVVGYKELWLRDYDEWIGWSPWVKIGPSGPTAVNITLSSAGWSNNTQSVTVSGMTSTALVFSTPADESMDKYGSCGVKLTSQSTNTLTFTCQTVPDTSLTVQIAYWLT